MAKIHERAPYRFHSLLAKSYQHNQNRHHDVSHRVPQLFVQHHFHKRGQQVSQQNRVAHQRQVGDAHHLASERGTRYIRTRRYGTFPSRPRHVSICLACWWKGKREVTSAYLGCVQSSCPFQHHCCGAMFWKQYYARRQQRPEF